MRPRALSNTPSLDDSMTTGTQEKLRVALDDGAGLVAIQARHQDVAEDQVRLVVVDLGQRVEAIFGQQHLVAALLQEDLGAAANGVAVVDDQHLVTRSVCAHGGRRSSIAIDDHCTAASYRRRKRGPMPCFRFQPFQSLLCGPRTRGRSSSSEPVPMAYLAQCHLRALPRLRHRSTRKSGTSRFSCSSSLKGPRLRMQRLYRGVTCAVTCVAQCATVWTAPRPMTNFPTTRRRHPETRDLSGAAPTRRTERDRRPA